MGERRKEAFEKSVNDIRDVPVGAEVLWTRSVTYVYQLSVGSEEELSTPTAAICPKDSGFSPFEVSHFPIH